MCRKKLIRLIVALIGVPLLLLSQATHELVSESGVLDGVVPDLEILYPTGEDSSMYGSTLTIQWSASDSSFGAVPISIFYSLHGEYEYTGIVAETENDSIFDWTIPEISTGNYVIKIVAIDTFRNVINKLGYPFFILGLNPGPYWYVSPDGNDSTNNGSEEFPYFSIQKALDMCTSGDSILVSAGIYHEHINTNNKSVYIRGLSGADFTFIDGDSTGENVVTLQGSSTITGFTIQHSGVQGYTGGIMVESGSPHIEFNKIIENNDGIICWGYSNSIIKNNIIAKAAALILCMDQSRVYVENNTLVSGGDGIHISNSNVRVTAINNIIASNNRWGGIYAPDPSDSLTFRYNDIWNNSPFNYNGISDLTGTDGNISEDALFINIDTLNVQLQPTSPAINSGDPSSDYSHEPEPNGDRINMGVYGNTNRAAIGYLKFTTTITDSCFEDSAYTQSFGISPEFGIIFTYSANTLPDWLTINKDSTGLEGTPINSDVENTQINISVTDNFNRTDTLSYTLHVLNTPPVFTTIPDTVTYEDETYFYDANSSDDDQGEIRYELLQPAWLNIDTLTGEVAGIPINDEVGAHPVTVKVVDGNGGQAIQDFTLYVLNVNDPPVLLPLPADQTIEDTPLVIYFSSWYDYVTDVDNSIESLTWNVLNSEHTQSLVHLDSVTIIPETNWFGLDTLTVIVSDSTLSDTSAFALEITLENDPPVWHLPNDTMMLSIDTLSIFLPDLVSDVDDPVDSLTFSYYLDFEPSEFSLLIEIDTLNYFKIVASVISELDSGKIYFTAIDTSEASTTDSIYLSVTKFNFPPTLSQLPDVYGVEGENSHIPLNLWRQYVTDIDDPIDSLGWYVPNTSNITITIENDTVIFSPKTNWFGTDILTVNVFDEEDITTGKIAAIFTNVADPPELTIADEFYLNEDETLTVYLDDMVYDVDSPDSTMEWQVSFEPIQINPKISPSMETMIHGSLHNNKSITFSSPESVDSCLHFILNNEERTLILYGEPNCFVDSVQIFYAVTDDSSLTVNDSNYVSILPVNDPPVAPEFFTLEKQLYEDIPFEIDLKEFQDEVSDIETPTSDLIWTLEPGNAVFIELVLDSNIYIMSSPSNWFGYDTLTIFITDIIDTVSSKLPIYLYPINDPPIITGIPDTSFNEDTTLTLNLDQFVHDVETPNNQLIWNITLASDSSALLIDWNPGSYNLTLIGRKDAFDDSIAIYYKVYDDSNAYDYDTSFVSIIPVNDPPAFLAYFDTTFNEDSQLLIQTEFWRNFIGDIDDPVSTITINVKRDSGVVFYQFDSDSLTHKFWANYNVNGVGYFTLTVTDSSSMSISTQFSVSIIPINDPPEIVDIPDTSTAQDTAFYLPLLPYTYDPDNDRSTLNWEFSAIISQVIHNPGSDTLKIIPQESYIGWDTIFATLTDDRGLADHDTFRIKFTDTSPPYFNIGIFQNPIASEHLDFYFFPDEEIDSIITVTIRKYDKEVTLLTKIHPSPYYCHHRLIVTDNFPVSISATDTTGNIGSTNYIFSATNVVASTGGIIYSPDSSTNLILPSNALSKDSYILCLPNASKSYNKEKPKELAIAKYNSKTQKLSYNFTGPDKLLKKSAKLLFYPDGGYTSSNDNWLGVFQLISGEWEYRKTYTDKNGIYFWIYTDELGTYKLDVGAPEKPVFVPSKFHLSQNFPNPFNPITTINFSLPEVKNGAFNIPTKLIVYDLLGREVTKLVNRSYLPGKYSISWDSRNSQGVPIASGIYIYRLEYGHYFKSKKMVLIK